MPTVRVDLFDTRATRVQKQQLAESLTTLVTETLGDPKESVTIVFESASSGDIARGGRLGRQQSHASVWTGAKGSA